MTHILKPLFDELIKLGNGRLRCYALCDFNRNGVRFIIMKIGKLYQTMVHIGRPNDHQLSRYTKIKLFHDSIKIFCGERTFIFHASTTPAQICGTKFAVKSSNVIGQYEECAPFVSLKNVNFYWTYGNSMCWLGSLSEPPLIAYPSNFGRFILTIQSVHKFEDMWIINRAYYINEPLTLVTTYEEYAFSRKSHKLFRLSEYGGSTYLTDGGSKLDLQKLEKILDSEYYKLNDRQIYIPDSAISAVDAVYEVMPKTKGLTKAALHTAEN